MTYADDKVKHRLFWQARGHNSKINDLFWPVLNLCEGPSKVLSLIGLLSFIPGIF